MEDVAAQPDASKEQHIIIFDNQQSAKTSSVVIPEVLLKTIGDMQTECVIFKERMERKDMMFQLILSILPPPPPYNH